MVKRVILVAALLLAAGAVGAEERVRAIGDIRRGEVVTVIGEVTRVRDYDEFLIRDETGRVRVYFPDGIDREELRSSESVTVTGRVDDDLIELFREIYATRIIFADGRVFETQGAGE